MFAISWSKTRWLTYKDGCKCLRSCKVNYHFRELTCQFTCSPPSLPPSYPEASQTQMFYTSYEMFEGRRHRKSAWAWFLLQGALEGPSPLFSVCYMHALISHSMDSSGLVTPMYNHPSKSCRIYFTVCWSMLALLYVASKTINKVESGAKNSFLCPHS